MQLLMKYSFLKMKMVLLCFVFYEGALAKNDFPQLLDINSAKFWELVKHHQNQKSVLVNFWASWCLPCVEEFPHLMELKAKYKDKVEFIFVSFDFENSRENALKFLHGQSMMDVSYLNVETEQEFLKSMPESWSGALPYTMFFSKKGKQVMAMEGGQSKEEFEKYIRITLSQ